MSPPCCCLPTVALHAADTFLVEDGQPRTEIAVSDKPQRSTRGAAQEWQALDSEDQRRTSAQLATHDYAERIRERLPRRLQELWEAMGLSSFHPSS